ncbi:uncharacterized protein METZ01_LOCUS119708 [marine metagenome]|uniref:Uncharacterized protein n=1 Tax=marine metagenome TaxID=408172 RepID=A0A381XPZ8_9ZZZZ
MTQRRIGGVVTGPGGTEDNTSKIFWRLPNETCVSIKIVNKRRKIYYNAGW